MADTTESKKAAINLPWATIAAVLAATGGFFFYLNPLQTSRPMERAGFHSDLDRPQDVDARLWQDPLRTTSEHDADILSRYKDSAKERDREDKHHSVTSLFDQLKDEPCWVLAVMIPGSAYAEYGEARLRVRQAVLEGLGERRYMPEDNEHIGYVRIDESDLGWHNVILPDEWGRRGVRGHS